MQWTQKKCGGCLWAKAEGSKGKTLGAAQTREGEAFPLDPALCFAMPPKMLASPI